MRVLIASSPNHHHHSRDAADGCGPVVEGELVVPALLDCGDPACRRCIESWVGLASDGCTPTAMVVDRPGVTRHDMVRALHDWLDRTGIVDTAVQAAATGDYRVDGVIIDDPVAAVADLVEMHLAAVNHACDAFADGSVLVRHAHRVTNSQVERAA